MTSAGREPGAGVWSMAVARPRRGSACVAVSGGAMTVIVAAGLAARMLAPRANDRDQPGNDRAEQRQEDDRLIHARLSPSSC